MVLFKGGGIFLAEGLLFMGFGNAASLCNSRVIAAMSREEINAASVPVNREMC